MSAKSVPHSREAPNRTHNSLAIAAQICEWTTSSDPQIRSLAAKVAAGSPSLLSARSAVELLSVDPDSSIRKISAQSAATLMIEGDALGLVLLEELLRDRSLTVRGAAVFALGRAARQVDEAVDVLIRCTLMFDTSMAMLAASELVSLMIASPQRCLELMAAHGDDFALTDTQAGREILNAVIQYAHVDPTQTKKILNGFRGHRDFSTADSAREKLSDLGTVFFDTV